MTLSLRARGFALVGLGVFVLSWDSLMLRLIGADAWTLAFWRAALSGVSIALLVAAIHGRGTLAAFLGVGRAGLGAALFYAVNAVAFCLAISNTSVANTLLILAATPLFAALLSGPILGERLARQTWLAIGAATLGIAVLVSGSLEPSMTRQSLAGDLAALATAAGLAVYFTLLRLGGKRDMTPVLAISAVPTVLICLPFAAPLALSGEAAWMMAGNGLLLVPAAFVLISRGPRYIAAAEVGLLMLLESVLGPVWVWLALGEEAGPRTLLGGGIVLATLFLYILWDARSSARGRRGAVRPERPLP